jgi:sporulation protein YlmC with PRC-barrel domain
LALVASPLALAQTTTPPAAKPDAGTTTQDKSVTSPTPAPGATTASKGDTWYSHQAGEMRASKLIGTSVKNNANETIGEVNEVVLAKDGKVAAVIIGVGGFLGIGEREVAVNFDALQHRMDNNNLVLSMNTTKDALKNAPAWTWTGDGAAKNTPAARTPSAPATSPSR